MKTGKKKAKGRIGSSLDDWLEDEGIFDECMAVAIKREAARRLDQAMSDRDPTPS